MKLLSHKNEENADEKFALKEYAARPVAFVIYYISLSSANKVTANFHILFVCLQPPFIRIRIYYGNLFYASWLA